MGVSMFAGREAFADVGGRVLCRRNRCLLRHSGIFIPAETLRHVIHPGPGMLAITKPFGRLSGLQIATPCPTAADGEELAHFIGQGIGIG